MEESPSILEIKWSDLDCSSLQDWYPTPGIEEDQWKEPFCLESKEQMNTIAYPLLMSISKMIISSSVMDISKKVLTLHMLLNSYKETIDTTEKHGVNSKSPRSKQATNHFSPSPNPNDHLHPQITLYKTQI